MGTDETQMTTHAPAEIVSPKSELHPRPSVANTPRVRWFALRQDIPAWAYKTLAVSSFAIMFLGWAWLSHQQFVNSVFLPTPERVWDTARAFVNDQNLWGDIKISVMRVTAGFLLSAALA